HQLSVACDHGAAADLTARRNSRLNLSQLDPEAADFHLVIRAAEEHHRAVLSAASEIARHIEPLARTNRITDEALGRQIGTAEISARELHAAEVEVPDHPRWHRPAMLVED